jgi:hypothetical protein
MRRVAGCLVVALLASAAAWVGCRDQDAELEGQVIGSGTDAGGGLDVIVVLDDAIVIGSDGGGEPGPGSDAGTTGSGSDAGTTGSGSDAGTTGSGSDAGTTGGGDDAGAPDDGNAGGTTDAGTGTGGRRGVGDEPIDRTSFYACAGGGSGSAIGAGLGLPLAVAFATARRRRRRRAARG